MNVLKEKNFPQHCKTTRQDGNDHRIGNLNLVRRSNYSEDTKRKVLKWIQSNISVMEVSRSFKLR